VQASGTRLTDDLHVAVNVGVLGGKPGCTIVLQDQSHRQLSIVEFSATGNPAMTYNGPVRHGTPRFSDTAYGALPRGEGRTNSAGSVPLDPGAQAGPTNTPSPQRAPLSGRDARPAVTVFFGTAKAVVVEEMVALGGRHLAHRGVKIDPGGRVVVRVEVQGENAGCSVEFFGKTAESLGKVRFGAQGEIAD
jgi:hypothetical protein